MPKSKPPYPEAFRTEAMDRVRSSGKPIAVVARDLGVSGETSRLWVRQKVRFAACLVGLAGVAGHDGRHAAAAQLLGAAQALCEAVGVPLEPADQRAYQGYLVGSWQALGAEAHTVAWTTGYTLGAAAALDDAPPSTEGDGAEEGEGRDAEPEADTGPEVSFDFAKAREAATDRADEYEE